MDAIIAFLRDNPLVLLFLVAGIGYPLGRIKIGGASLGVAAVLFVGLAFGAISPDLKLPEIIYTLGLVLFVYTIGLSSGSVFFTSLKKKGAQYNLLVIAGLVFAVGLAAGAHFLFQINTSMTAGMFSGALTNTPALAGVVEHIKAIASPQTLELMQSEPVISYSLTYPVGVLGMILMIYIFQKMVKVDYSAEARKVSDFSVGNEPLHNLTVRVNRDQTDTIQTLMVANEWSVLFGRIRRVEGDLELVKGDTTLKEGDLVTMVGTDEALSEVTPVLGEATQEHLEFDLTKYDKRRVFISNPQIAGRRVKDINLNGKFSGFISRVRRGDLELLPRGNTTLSLGDQVRVIAPHQTMDDIAAYLGDSYKAVSEIDMLTFSLGLALGILLGMLPIPLPGGLTLKLGVAGGPLIVSLILGAVGRSGPMVWGIPYSANLTLRQIGLILFLAGVGTRSGYAFFSTLSQGDGVLVFLGGVMITCLTTLFMLFIGYKLLKIPMGLLIGIISGLQTQPAVLGFALEQTHDELPNIGYASVYPVAMISKIVFAQVLLILFLIKKSI